MIDKESIKNDIDKIKKLCDFTIAYVHTGNEYVRKPEESTVKLFHEIADMGADCIIGNHPHVPRRTEVYDSNGKKVFIIYACGNFISAQRKPYTDTGVIVNMDVIKKDSDTTVEKVEIVPVYVLKYKVGSKIIYRVVKCSDIDKYKEATKEQIDYAKKVGLEILEEDEPALEVLKINN
jgi:poly-gamma-glutamate synthesis protein (capsule biosynthesis protein)